VPSVDAETWREVSVEGGRGAVALGGDDATRRHSRRCADSAGRIAQLDVLRAVAAVAVVWVHYRRYPHDNLVAVVPWLSELLAANDRLLQMVWPRGWSHPGVILFIVLSGFCIDLPQAGRPERALALKAFFRRRFFRIYPVYLRTWAGLVANAWLAPRGNMWVQPQPWSVARWCRRFWRLAFWPWPLPLGNTILHTVLAEMGLYLIYPALLAVVRRVGLGAGVGRERGGVGRGDVLHAGDAGGVGVYVDVGLFVLLVARGFCRRATGARARAGGGGVALRATVLGAHLVFNMWCGFRRCRC